VKMILLHDLIVCMFSYCPQEAFVHVTPKYAFSVVVIVVIVGFREVCVFV